MVLLAIPEVVERVLESSLEARDESLSSLRELGPPDLVHLIKQSPKSTRQAGQYHHVTGIDASSSASLAAYINTLTQAPSDKTLRVVSGTYCAYNAFSRLDMRVEVKIPGGVESYCIDERGEKRVASDSLWLETFVCGVLRAYSYADDGTGEALRKIVALRRFNPIPTIELEEKFLDAAEKLFFKGWQLGSDPEVQVPNIVANHLTTGLLEFIRTTGRFSTGAQLFDKLSLRDAEISSLLARVLFEGDEEVRAIRLLRDSISEIPMDYPLLMSQAQYLQAKGELEWALPLAQRAVVAAPSEFGTWSLLADIYVGREQWDLALLTLNSCPMFTHQDKDTPILPEPARILLPLLPEAVYEELDEAVSAYNQDLIHPSLRKLTGATYQGTFLKAYKLLTEIAAKIGWDQLLRIRSEVFVMEEEYRTEKSQPNTAHSVRTSGMRSASNTAIHESPATNGAPHDEELHRPDNTITSTEVLAGGEDPDPSHNDYTAFQHKRLCERWLDTLFMVLYEDLRVYTVWRTDMARAKITNRSNNNNTNDKNGAGTDTPTEGSFAKNPQELELLGALAERLQHPAEAIEAYEACLAKGFSPRALLAVVKMQEREGKVEKALGGLVKLIVWQYKWYSEFCPTLLKLMRQIIDVEGIVKVRSYLQASNMPGPAVKLASEYIDRCEAFATEEG